MDFTTIRNNLREYKYTSIQDFHADLMLICKNAMVYNQPESVYYKSAVKLQNYISGLIENAKKRCEMIKVSSGGVWNADFLKDMNIFGENK